MLNSKETRSVLMLWVLSLAGCSDAGVLQLDTGNAAGTVGEGTGGGELDTSDSDNLPPSDVGTSVPEPEAGCWETPPATVVLHVRVDGDDTTGDGSDAAPWASIAHAVASAPDGARVEVGPGEYVGEQALEGTFDTGIVVRAEPRYLARLRNSGPVVTLSRAQGITLEGFDIAHDAAGADAYVVHVFDAIDGDDVPTRIVVRDNVIHDSYNNDLLRVDSGVTGVTIEGNVLFNQGASDEQLDINAARDVLVRRNIFFNDFAASGRPAGQDTASFIVVKDADGGDDGIEGASEVEIDGNIFMSWQGDPSMNFILLAERGNPIYGARDVVVQNNLMLGDGGDPMRAPFGVKGARDVVFRNNTVVGDIPANAFAFRLNVEGDSPPNDGIEFYNNIWSAPSGTIEDLTDTEPSSPLQNFVLDTNLYWNGGAPIPNDATDVVNVDSDLTPILGDPALPSSPIENPVWSATTQTFGDGAETICDAFDDLALEHATPGASGAGLGVAKQDQLPPRDLLGRVRSAADLGALSAP